MTFRTIRLLFCTCLIVFAADARADCDRPALAHQRRDAATIQRLESAWSLAYLSGGAEFETCLLTPDFTEIMSNGSINHLSLELELAKKNKGKAVTAPNMPPITIHIHGDVESLTESPQRSWSMGSGTDLILPTTTSGKAGYGTCTSHSRRPSQCEPLAGGARSVSNSITTHWPIASIVRRSIVIVCQGETLLNT